MTDETTGADAGATDSKAAKVATIESSVAPREIYATLPLALERFNLIQAMPDAAGVVPIITGLQVDPETGETTIDESKYPGTHEVMVAKLTRNVKSEKPGEPGKMILVGIIVHPIPTADTLAGVALPAENTNTFTDAMREILRKEMNFRAVRPLRKALTGSPEAPSLETLAAEMPVTTQEYCEGQRTGGIMESFDTVASDVLKLLVKASPLFRRAKLTKAEFRKALESAAYAQFHYAPIEERGRFAEALTLAARYAETKGLSVDIFTRWANTRDEQTYDPTDSEGDDADSFDVEAMLAAATAPATTDAKADAEQPAA